MTAPSPAAAGLPLEDVERMARVLWEASGAAAKRWTWPNVGSILRDHYRRLAAAALAEMRPTAVPDPRFRDQLAEALAATVSDYADDCEPDCDDVNLRQIAADEVQCTVCGLRRACGGDE